jgi:hypothetical protein
MVISPCRKEGSRDAQSLDYIESENAMVKPDGSFQIRDFQMDVSDANGAVNRHIIKLAQGINETGGTNCGQANADRERAVTLSPSGKISKN